MCKSDGEPHGLVLLKFNSTWDETNQTWENEDSEEENEDERRGLGSDRAVAWSSLR